MSQIENHTYDELQVGDEATLIRRLTIDDLRLFAGGSARLNPEHMDADAARSDLYHKAIANGMWGAGLVATLVTTEMPGPGTEFIDQHLTHLRPVSIGETVTVTVRVHEKQGDRQVMLDCQCVNEHGEDVLRGIYIVRAPTEKLSREHTQISPAEAELQTKGRQRRQLKRLLDLAHDLDPILTAVVHPVDALSLEGVVRAAEHNLLVPILVGPEHRIRATAEEAELDISQFKLVATEHSHQSAEQGVAMAKNRDVEALMKGSLHTDELMGAVVRRDGLRTERRVSHVYCMDVPTYPRPLLVTDAAINIHPGLLAKRDILQNAIELAHALDNPEPRAAILSATESVNPDLQSTLDAAALCKMADRGQIHGGLLDGPLAFDNAISRAAARTKGIRSEVAGQADILLVPDLESGNMVAKQLYYLADAEAAGIVLGAKVPIVLTSRADDVVARLASCAIALLVAERKRKGLAHL
ncbi:bifunctional enoyl-CoA hydratase/phosphate acetyltransferase [Alkalilimnicola ehrlichii MLHE-1]|uniref:Phosphate butyryltransferase n=1 Tax=Alkalilimnicola ehrlichii (strain ATCC BAA-1101 / DSM 17681 / MLHE-1) TaxID=187272 RepID=Q0A619_ALKEH|nr:bifunctional enoyl-CoA hydratase/phosphate acetyltransferase [Alkalilimnicola ehrlichii]ABI57718.1 phosphate butyryltransferase [Alkalilimnicola ehrlichii MLHE-1]